jgi:Ribonuclease G/E
MLYNDEETRKDEERFQEHLKKARSITKEDMDRLMEHMETIAEVALKLKSKPSLTDEEAALLERIKSMIAETAQGISDSQLILGESARRQAYAYYLHVKKLAEEGNADAIKIYEDLKPGYQASLRSDIGDN